MNYSNMTTKITNHITKYLLMLIPNANTTAVQPILESNSIYITGLLSLSQLHHSHLNHFLGFLTGLLGNNSCDRNNFCNLMFER